jgi:hypothetical protein
VDVPEHVDVGGLGVAASAEPLGDVEVVRRRLAAGVPGADADPATRRAWIWLVAGNPVRRTRNRRFAVRTAHLSSLVLMYCARSVSEFRRRSLYGALSRLSSDAAAGANRC